MEERPISSRMQELLQRAADERQAEQHRQGETVESLRIRLDELSAGVAAGNEKLTDKIDATFALTASTVEILQRLADRVDALERSLDDIMMRLGSISWRMEEVREGEGRLAERIDESALALAEAMFATGHGRRSNTGTLNSHPTVADHSGPDHSAWTIPPWTIPARSAPARTIRARTVPPRTAPARTVSPRTAPPRTVSPRTAPPRTVPPRTAPPRTISARTASARTVSPRTAPARTASPRTILHRTAPARTIRLGTVRPGPHRPWSHRLRSRPRRGKRR